MRQWAGSMFLSILVDCSGGDGPAAIDAPTGGDGGGDGDAASVDAPAADGGGAVDGAPIDTLGPPDGFQLPDGLIGTDCVIGAEIIGPGHVVSTPAGINCAPDCRETVACGTAVTLTALPNPGSTFAGWMGACTGAGACTLTANGPLTLAFARFQ